MAVNYLEKFRTKTKRSKEIFDELKNLIPFGVNSNYRYLDPNPIYFKNGRGSKLYDADGNEYIDFNMAFGALTIGHSHPTLISELNDRIMNGTILGFEYEGSLRLAKLLSKIYGIESMRFSTTGGEATQAAIRIARAYTGKKKILKFEGCYHGSHDTLLVSVKPQKGKGGYYKEPKPVISGPGVMEEVLSNILVAPFNNIEAVDDIIRKNYNEIAGIILEPVPMNMGLIIPEKGFLEELRKLSDEYGIVLIFDEIKTGSKHFGGATSYFKVKPDLMTLGKAIAGGFPLSVIGGKSEIMNTLGPGKTPHAGTFNSNPLSIDAAIITLDKIFKEREIQYAENLSKELNDSYNDVIKDFKIPMNVNSWAISGSLYFGIDKVNNWRDFLNTNVSLWYQYLYGMMYYGVIPAAPGPDEQWTVSIVHNKEDVERNVEVFKLISEDLKNIRSEIPVEESI